MWSSTGGPPPIFGGILAKSMMTYDFPDDIGRKTFGPPNPVDFMLCYKLMDPTLVWNQTNSKNFPFSLESFTRDLFYQHSRAPLI